MAVRRKQAVRIEPGSFNLGLRGLIVQVMIID